MRIDNKSSFSSKEIAFKAKKKDENDPNLLDYLQALLVRKMKRKYQVKPKFFSSGQLGHFASKYPHTDQVDNYEKNEMFFKKKPWNQNN